ncbi:MAG: hypothetical protein ACXWDN_18575, partial [Limisphaerales bacterium]
PSFISALKTSFPAAQEPCHLPENAVFCQKKVRFLSLVSLLSLASLQFLPSSHYIYKTSPVTATSDWKPDVRSA